MATTPRNLSEAEAMVTGDDLDAVMDAKNSVPMSGRSGGGITITGMLLDERDLGPLSFNPKNNTIAFTVAVGSISDLVQKAANRSTLWKALPNGTGLRFNTSQRFMKAENVHMYRNTLLRYEAKQAGLDSVDALDQAAHDKVEAVLKANETHGNKGSLWCVDYNHPAFRDWTGPQLCTLDGHQIKVEVPNPQSKGSAPDVSAVPAGLVAGTHVRITDLQINMYVTKPKKKEEDTKAAAAATTTTTPSPNPGNGEVVTAAAVAHEEGGVDEDDTVVDGPLSHLVDPVTRQGFIVSWKAASITRIPTPYNDLPLEYQLANFTDIHAQVLHNPFIESQGNYPKGLLFCPLTDSNSKDVTLDKGVVFGKSVPGRYLEETKEELLADSPLTYKMGKKPTDTDGPGMPLKMRAYNVLRIPQSEVDEAGGNVPEKYAAEYDSLLPCGAQHKYVASEFQIIAQMWPSQIYSAGIADLDTWADVNAYARIPCNVALRYYRENKHNDKQLEMSVAAVGWRTKEYLYKHAFPVSLAMAQRILGNEKNAKGPVTFGNYLNFKKYIPAVNLGNKQRGKRDLLNASESQVELAPYLDPKQGWEPRVLMVTNTGTFTLKTFSDRDRATVLGLLTRARTLKTAEEGDKFIQDYVAARAPRDFETLEEFGYLQQGARVSVWFVKPDSAVYPAGPLSTPYYKTLLPKKVQPVAAIPVPPPVIAVVDVPPTIPGSPQPPPAELPTSPRRNPPRAKRSRSVSHDGEKEKEKRPKKRSRLDTIKEQEGGTDSMDVDSQELMDGSDDFKE